MSIMSLNLTAPGQTKAVVVDSVAAVIPSPAYPQGVFAPGVAS